MIWITNLEQEYPNYKALSKPFQKPNYWVFGVLVPNKTEAILHFREKGFYASGVHLPNNNYSVFGKNGNLPGIEEFNSKFLALPSGWWL